MAFKKTKQEALDLLQEKEKRLAELTEESAYAVQMVQNTIDNLQAVNSDIQTILQYVETDIIRQKRPDYWVGFVASILELFPNEWDYVLIPDCRFPNEIDYLKEAGLDTVNLRVVRKNFKSPLTPEQQAHPSETALDDVEPDYYITNNGSMTDLKRNVIDWLVEYLGSHQMTIDEL